MAKQIRITIDTDSLLVLQGRTSFRVWCPACAAEVDAIAVGQTAVISNLDHSAVEAWINSAALHHLETTDGSTLICLNSLLACVQKTKTC